METAIDTIVQGCTHYPLIKNEVQGLLKDVGIVDSSDTTAAVVRRVLMYHDDFKESDGGGISRVFLKDYTETFKLIGEAIVGRHLKDMKLISLRYLDGRVAYDSIILYGVGVNEKDYSIFTNSDIDFCSPLWGDCEWNCL